MRTIVETIVPRAKRVGCDGGQLPLAMGWIGEIDLETGEVARLPFAAYPEGIVLGEIR